jgi:hypothetical protein
MVSPALQCLAGGALVLAGMLLALGLARLAANVFIALVAVVAVGAAVFAILNGQWVGWGDTVWHSLALGLLAALFCLPALPFSSFHNKRK